MVKSRTSLTIISSILLILISVAATYLGLVSLGYVHTSGIELEIKLSDASKVYDGTALLPSEYEIVSGKLDKGDKLVVEFIGGQTSVGVGVSNANVYVQDEKGFDVTKDYAIKVNGGNLLVTARALNIELDPNKKVYDGTPLSETTFNIVDGELVTGHKLVPSFNTSVTNAGDKEQAVMTAKIFDEAGIDVTSNYTLNIDATDAELTIDKRPLVVTSASASKVFDGTELTNHEVTTKGLVEGHEFRIISGSSQSSIINVGTVDNVLDNIEYDIFDEDGKSVKDDYVVAYQNVGKLTITPLVLNVTTPSMEFEYNAEAHKFEFAVEDIFDAKDFEFIKSLGYSVSIGEPITKTNAGDYKNTPLIVIANEFGAEQSNIVLDIEAGIARITKKHLVIYGESLKEIYPGKDANGKDIEIKSKEEPGNIDLEKSTKISEQHVITAFYSASSKLSKVGSVENKIEGVYIQDKDTFEDVSANYSYLLVPGIIEITKLQLVIETPNLEFDYGWDYDDEDDTFKPDDNYKELRGDTDYLEENNLKLKNIHEPEETVLGAGTFKNIAKFEITKEDGTDVTELFDITYVYGDLTIYEKEITIYLPDINRVFDGTNELKFTLEEILNYNASLNNDINKLLLKNQELKLVKNIAKTNQDEDGKDVIFGKGNYLIDGTYFNIFETSDSIINSDYEKVTNVNANYSLKIEKGTFEIKKRTFELNELEFENVEYGDYQKYFENYSEKATLKNPIDNEKLVLSLGFDENVILEDVYTGQEHLIYVYAIKIVRELAGKKVDITKYYDIPLEEDSNKLISPIELGSVEVVKKAIKIETNSFEYQYFGGEITCDNIKDTKLKGLKFEDEKLHEDYVTDVENTIDIDAYYKVVNADDFVDVDELYYIEDLPKYFNAGTYQNEIEFVLVDEDNYIIEYTKCGEITINKIKIDAALRGDIDLNFGEELYTTSNLLALGNNAITDFNYFIGYDDKGVSSFVDGDVVTAVYPSGNIKFSDIIKSEKETDSSKKAKVYIGKIVISDKFGKDVTDNYDINYKYINDKNGSEYSATIGYKDINLEVYGGTFETTYNPNEAVIFGYGDGEYDFVYTYRYVYEEDSFEGVIDGLHLEFEATDLNEFTNAGIYEVKFRVKSAIYKGVNIIGADFFKYGQNDRPMKCIINPKRVSFTAPSMSFTYGDVYDTRSVDEWLNSYAFNVDDTNPFYGVTIQDILQGASVPTLDDAKVYNTVEGYTFDSNYDVTFINGTITIYPKKVNIVAPNVTVEYGNYNYQSDIEAWVNEQNDEDGDSFINAYSIRQLSTDDAVDTYDAFDTFELRESPNYDITYVSGTITVTPKKVTLQAPSYTFEYDSDFNYQELIETWVRKQYDEETGVEYISYYDLPQATDITDTDPYPTLLNCRLTENENYDISFENGEIYVTKKKVSLVAPTLTMEYNPEGEYDFSGVERWLDSSAFQNSNVKVGDILTGFDYPELEEINRPYNTINNPQYSEYYEVSLEKGTTTLTKKKVSLVAPTLVVLEGVDYSMTLENWANSESVSEYISCEFTTETQTGSHDTVVGYSVIDEQNYDITFINGTITIVPNEGQ